jgi:anti-sigma regulatory factor (Ser/Thr protein kinase)
VEAHALLAGDARSVSVARRLLAQLLDARGVPSSQRSDALVASELVANAIRHGSRPGDKIAVEFAVRPRCIRICVRDPVRSSSSPAALSADARRPSGRGLQIVEQLADWSERFVNGRREVRATVALHQREAGTVERGMSSRS